LPGVNPTRRQLLIGLTAAVALLRTGAVAPAQASAAPTPSLDPLTRDTLEAFADTIIPGEKRTPADLVVAGAAAGPGAVQAGAINVLTLPELPLAPLLPALAALLNVSATTYAATNLVLVNPLLPPFVALPFRHRTALAKELLGPGLDDKLWTLLAAIASLSFDTAAHLHTASAAKSHPGLRFQRFPRPDADGLWWYRSFSYGRKLARRHPATTRTGNPA
jgi:hypothetical protein